ncbi:alpha-ketoglutarate-dependent dioxygenase AlkB [Photobacterium sp. ZSDE20]|uniref:Alpha-ketoglutarate-dependent dioxygenase AlkB n=1 Tax=Photobacterium pectinilyticum TaxID=2906793 RepID=A0ABT1MZY2_9GAMM|nr:alpha-ketoglutarate-dependent dioxygenase AlkB [Photobacterium sp. ZSDE20]MCQ1057964.1 alpha-ketoglutarate-dependent dioxygenase AlkB [Photobacterium sp. ZSDE20]MDD1822496.1 alpha-ketoglutarate-dependent dioxygenase AlkB [Photobacterium sp. ZSDE20]
MSVTNLKYSHHGYWQDLPQGRVYWQPNFLASSLAVQCYRQLDSELNWQQQKIRMFGREILQPRLQAWCGEAEYTYSGLTMQPDPWTPTLQAIRQQLSALLGQNFNSVLANQYRNGDDYMGWHQDNEPELGEEPVIASISLGATRRFVLRHRQSKEKKEYLLTNGSLLVMAGELQSFWQHTVPKTKRPTEPRINLTFRQITR